MVRYELATFVFFDSALFDTARSGIILASQTKNLKVNFNLLLEIPFKG